MSNGGELICDVYRKCDYLDKEQYLRRVVLWSNDKPVQGHNLLLSSMRFPHELGIVFVSMTFMVEEEAGALHFDCFRRARPCALCVLTTSVVFAMCAKIFPNGGP